MRVLQLKVPLLNTLRSLVLTAGPSYASWSALITVGAV